MSEIQASNNEQNKNVVTNEGKFKSLPKEYVDDNNSKDENLIESIKLLKEYSKDVALRYSSVTSDINVINLTLAKILKELESKES